MKYETNSQKSPAAETVNEPKPQMKINIDDDVFIINHTYTGTQTIQEIYENFLKRKLENS